MRFNFSISVLRKILAATLVAGLVPLALTSYSALSGYQTASDRAASTAITLLDEKSLHALQLRTSETAQAVSRFLSGRVEDLETFALLPRVPETYLDFYQTHQSELWYQIGTTAAPREHREMVPLYREVAYIDAEGQEQIRIQNGQIVPADELRNVSNPANTTYKTEAYFSRTRSLFENEIYVSHVTGWHVSVALQPASQTGPDQTAPGADYASFEAVIRFAKPLYTQDGDFDGMVMLSLDLRHLMEFSLHIAPVSDDPWTVYPDYVTGNYAFIFDNEGYTIAHPRLARIRGLDQNGQLIPYMTAGMSSEEQQKHPFNNRYGGWSDPNLPKVYAAVMNGVGGFTVGINRAGTEKATTYAPIPFEHGVYRESGIFGGIVVGANTQEFHKDANTVNDIIRSERSKFQGNTQWIALLGVIFLTSAALVVTRGITRPLTRLTEAARAMERGELDTATLDSLLQQRFKDEVTTLTQVFKQMAEKVQMRERRLREQVAQLNIQIDEAKKRRQVDEITESEYFQYLRANAENLRKRTRPASKGTGDTPDSSGSDKPTEGDAKE